MKAEFTHEEQRDDETAMNLREGLPKLCGQILLVSAGSEITPGEANALKTGLLSDNAGGADRADLTVQRCQLFAKKNKHF
jgi:hypothetical protein